MQADWVMISYYIFKSAHHLSPSRSACLMLLLACAVVALKRILTCPAGLLRGVIHHIYHEFIQIYALRCVCMFSQRRAACWCSRRTTIVEERGFAFLCAEI